METYSVRASHVPGRLTRCVPVDKGLAPCVCQECHSTYDEAECRLVDDGIPTHGVCPSCRAVRRARFFARLCKRGPCRLWAGHDGDCKPLQA
jgi:hypothetical protein